MENVSNKKLSIVFSFYNEEKNIVELIQRCQKVISGLIADNKIETYELIFVNDSSTDNTLNILIEENKKNPNIKIINMSRNFGQPQCLMAGLRHSKGDATVILDADLQDPPEIIPKLIDEWLNGIDVVHTIRKKRHGETKLKLFITNLGYLILNKTISEVSLPLNAGDYKLFSKRALEHIIKFKENKPFIRGLACWIGFKQSFILYEREARFAGKTKFPIISKRVLDNFLKSALISFTEAPLYISLMIGFVLSSISILYLIFIIIQRIFKFNILPVMPGWTTIVVLILLFNGIQLFTTGILGLYIGNMYIELKKRPNYIIENTIGLEKEKSEG